MSERLVVMNGAADDRPGDAGSPLRSARELSSRLSALRGVVRRDRRATSLPLLVTGSVAAAVMLPAVIWLQSWLDGPLGSFLQSTAIGAAFSVIWIAGRRRAALAGVGTGRGWGGAVLMAILLVFPLGLISIVAGPFLTLAVGLLIAGRRQRNAAIAWTGAVLGLLGIMNHLDWFTNRLPLAWWHPWVEPAINVLLALLTVVAGLYWRHRENQAA